MSIASSITNRYQKKYRIVFLGDPGVGKTSIIEQYTTGRFQQVNNSTVGIDFNVKDITYKSQQFRLQMWDTAGQERYRSLIPTYLKNAHIAVLVFDLSNAKTFENIDVWYKMFKQHQDSAVIVVGNKSDLGSKKINKTDIEAMMQKYKAQYIEISAKTGKKVDELFFSVIDHILKGSQKNEEEITKEHQQANIAETIKQINEKQSPKNTNIKVGNQIIKIQQKKKSKVKKCCND